MKDDDIKDQVEHMKSLVIEITKTLKYLNDQKCRLNNDILELSRKIQNKDDIHITDHCIVRYFERKLGYDINDIKSRIITNSVLYKYNNLNNQRLIEIDKDVSVCICNKTAITIYKNDMI